MTRESKDELIEVETYIYRETANAILIGDEAEEPEAGEDKHWLPKSQITMAGTRGDVSVIMVPEWLALKTGLI